MIDSGRWTRYVTLFRIFFAIGMIVRSISTDHPEGIRTRGRTSRAMSSGNWGQSRGVSSCKLTARSSAQITCLHLLSRSVYVKSNTAGFFLLFVSYVLRRERNRKRRSIVRLSVVNVPFSRLIALDAARWRASIADHQENESKISPDLHSCTVQNAQCEITAANDANEQLDQMPNYSFPIC